MSHIQQGEKLSIHEQVANPFAASISVQYTKPGASPVPEAAHPSIQYAARLAVNLIAAGNFDVPAWEAALVPYFELVTASPEPATIARVLLLRSANKADDAEGDNCWTSDDATSSLPAFEVFSIPPSALGLCVSPTVVCRVRESAEDARPLKGQARLQLEQFPASADRLEIRLAHRLLDIRERTAERRERNLTLFLFRIEEIHAGRMTFLEYP
ncbi:hypothetical protein RSOL_219300, partial [Rhizoctonia solani AG-3 Rhs1AP]